MKTIGFNFDLPGHLVAQYPSKERGMSRLMTLDRATGIRSHKMISDLPEILIKLKKPLLVFNDTKVRKARLIGALKDTQKTAEFLLLEKTADGCWKTMVNRARRRKEGSVYIFFDTEKKETARAVVKGFDNGCLLLEFDRNIDDNWLDIYGHIPLPPYIKRKDTPSDSQRYQTIYAKQPGSSAAPTAGLHFTREILDKLSSYGIESAYITLHVGLGTFLPVRSENIEDHIMHKEQFIITQDNAEKIETAKKEGGKIIAVGTTSLRALESAFVNGQLKQGEQSTSIFIYPGYNFKITDALFTNFHTPLSTLLMLVCAFAGKDFIMESYKEAVEKEYRFFSYGDAMLID